MAKAFRKYVAALLLAVISAYFGHLLAEGLAGAGHAASPQMVFMADDDGHGDFGGHRHDHGMSCDIWLCSGFSGVMLGTEAVVPLNGNIEHKLFATSKSNGFPSRTIEPLIAPPKA
jgi:hypothetical protein